MEVYFNTKETLEILKITKLTLNRLEELGLPVRREGRSKLYNIDEVKVWLERSQNKIESLLIGKVYRNDEIANIFGCATQGGMRRSHVTNTLVIFSDHTGADYEDTWTVDEKGDEILLYVGMGKKDKGDQDINFGQNKTLSESADNGVIVYLFEAYKPAEHLFRGKVHLVGSPYTDTQAGRRVWIFPLKISSNNFVISEEIIQENIEKKHRDAERLDDLTLLERAKRVSGQSKRTVKSHTYVRDAYVSELSKRRANGICDLCGEPAPFLDKKGNPYLESHHIHWLSHGGDDTIYNTVALDPTCHRKIHILNDKKDNILLQKRIDYYRSLDL